MSLHQWLESLEHRIGMKGQALSDTTRRIMRHVSERTVVSRDVHQEMSDKETFGQRLADQVAQFGGSWTFISLFAGFLVLWTLFNTYVLLSNAFDPFPYIFLNLMLSMLAAAQAPLILMSQNRQSLKDRAAAQHDYEVNLKAELEIMALHDKIDQLRQDNFAALIAKQDEQIRLLTQLVQSGRS